MKINLEKTSVTAMARPGKEQKTVDTKLISN